MRVSDERLKDLASGWIKWANPEEWESMAQELKIMRKLEEKVIDHINKYDAGHEYMGEALQALDALEQS